MRSNYVGTKYAYPITYTSLPRKLPFGSMRHTIGFFFLYASFIRFSDFVLGYMKAVIKLVPVNSGLGLDLIVCSISRETTSGLSFFFCYRNLVKCRT